MEKSSNQGFKFHTSHRKHTGRQVYRIILRIKASPWRFVPQQHTFPFDLLDFRFRLRKEPHFTMCNEGNSNFRSDPQLSRCLEMGNSSEFLLLKEEAQTIKWWTRNEAGLHSAILSLTVHWQPGPAADLSKHWWDAVSFTEFQRMSHRGWLGYGWMVACLLSRLYSKHNIEQHETKQAANPNASVGA